MENAVSTKRNVFSTSEIEVQTFAKLRGLSQEEDMWLPLMSGWNNKKRIMITAVAIITAVVELPLSALTISQDMLGRMNASVLWGGKYFVCTELEHLLVCRIRSLYPTS